MIPNEEKAEWHYLIAKKSVYIIKRNNIKRKFKFKDYKKCLKASQIENKIKCLEKKLILSVLNKIKKSS